MDASLGLWLTIAACGVVTFLLRLSFIAVHGRVVMPLWFTRALAFVPIAVLSAITLPEVLIQNGALPTSVLNPRVIAALVAVLVAWRTRNVTVTIVAGTLTLWLVQYLLR